MLGRFTCTIHQLLIRSSCFVENNLLLIQGFQVSVYSLKSVSPTLCIETSSSPLFSPLFLFLIPLSPHSSFHPSSSTPSLLTLLLTPLLTPPPDPFSPHPFSHPSSSPWSLLTLLLIPPPHPFSPHPSSSHPSSSPGSAASFVIFICLNQNFVGEQNSIFLPIACVINFGL